MTKNELLNQLATSYAKGDSFAFEKLFTELGSFIKNQAKRAANRSENLYVFIPATEFESAYLEALWEAARSYDNSSEFFQRLHICMKRNEAKVWRSYQTKQNGKAVYVKGKILYLDKPITGENGNETLGDIVSRKMSNATMVDEVVGERALLDAIAKFKAQNKKYYFIVKALSREATNEEISKSLGEATYNGKVRSVVYRARSAFKKYLIENGFDIRIFFFVSK